MSWGHVSKASTWLQIVVIGTQQARKLSRLTPPAYLLNLSGTGLQRLPPHWLSNSLLEDDKGPNGILGKCLHEREQPLGLNWRHWLWKVIWRMRNRVYSTCRQKSQVPLGHMISWSVLFIHRESMLCQTHVGYQQ